MRRKIWFCISAVTAVIAAEFLFQSGVLLVRYHERRQGIFLLMSGLAVGMLYTWSFYQGMNKISDFEDEPEHAWEKRIRNEMVSALIFGIAGAGILLHWIRYRGTITIVVSIIVFILIYAGVAAMIIWLVNRRRNLKHD